jgi:hemerythrin
VNQEHAAFLRSLNKLHSAMIQGKEKSVTGALLRELPASVRDHFATEESLMKSTNYPRLAEHRARHEEFTRQLNEFVTLLERGDRGLSILLLVSMREHISAHIQKDDQAYVPWLTEQWGAVSLCRQWLLVQAGANMVIFKRRHVCIELPETFPQRLKPGPFVAFCGTTEVMPCYKASKFYCRIEFFRSL